MNNLQGNQMTDTNTYIQKLEDSYPLREPVLRTAIRALQLPLGSRGLDAACGIGQPTFLLAESIGSEGKVIGIDLNARFISLAKTKAEESDLSSNISFREGDIRQLPFNGDTFDWVWSCDCVGYPTGRLPRQLKELARFHDLRPDKAAL